MFNYLLTADGGMTSLIMMGGILVLMYTKVLMPQKKQQKKDAAMRDSLEIGDEVLTQGGILGRIVSIKEDYLVIETGSDRIKLRMVKNAIAHNVTHPPQPASRGFLGSLFGGRNSSSSGDK